MPRRTHKASGARGSWITRASSVNGSKVRASSAPYAVRTRAGQDDGRLSSNWIREGHIVELGPGTGPVTQALLARGIAPERLVLVEYESRFCHLLSERFPGVTIVQGDAYGLKATLDGKVPGKIATVVSSLPLPGAA